MEYLLKKFNGGGERGEDHTGYWWLPVLWEVILYGTIYRKYPHYKIIVLDANVCRKY